MILTSQIAPAIIDENQNGISDVWERQYHSGNLIENLDPQADPDGDGWSNAKEAAAGTDPFSANPPDGILRPSTVHTPAVWGDSNNDGIPDIITPEAITVSWVPRVGKLQTLEMSFDLTPGSWIPAAGDPFIGNGNQVNYSFQTDDADKRFWRVAVTDTDTDGDDLTDAEEHALHLDPTLPQTLPGVPDLWLGQNFQASLAAWGPSSIDLNADPDGDGTSTLEELLAKTDPNFADPLDSRRWIAVHGNGEQDETITRTGTLTIPAGTSAILIVASASEEYPEWTGISSDYNDLLEWTVTPSQGTPIHGAIDVNERHDDWDADLINGTSLPGLPSPVHIEETRILTAPAGSDLTINVSVSATNIEDSYYPSHVAVGLVPVEVSWRAIADFDNVDDHIDPWTGITNGKRIFPGFKNPDDTTIRHKLQLVVKTSSALAGKTAYVKSFDVDDSTSEGFDHIDYGTTPVIDTNGTKGDDNLPDYLSTDKKGQFWNNTTSTWGGNTSSAIIAPNGEATFDFRVGMQPGNNYRVVASVIDESMYANVQSDNPAVAKYLGPDPAQSGSAPASPLLTVWRRLWVENDSMGAIPTDTFGYKRNDLSWNLDPPTIRSVSFDSASGKTSFGIDAITDQSSFLNLDNGRIIVQSVEYPVVGTESYGVYISGNHGSIPVGSGFRLYDDDDLGLDGPSLPRYSIANEQMSTYFKTSFIKIVDAVDFNPNSEVPFVPNQDVSTNLYGQENTVVNDARDLTDKNELWIAPLTAAYQGPMDADQDGNGVGENGRQGETASYGDYDHSSVFIEGCRENYWSQLQSKNPITLVEANRALKLWIVAVASHEIGHQPAHQDEATDHAELGLMSASMNSVSSSTPEEARFKPKTIKRFRKANRWSN